MNISPALSYQIPFFVAMLKIQEKNLLFSLNLSTNFAPPPLAIW